MTMRTEAVELLEELTRLGAVAEPREGRLRLRFPEDRRPEVERLRPRLEAVKPELMTVLAGGKVAAVRREEYHRRATEALRSIGAITDLADALRWLERTEPARHRRLLDVLPGHLDYLWESGARLDVFQAALDDWVRAHQNAAEDCRRQCVAPRSSHERTQRQEQHGLHKTVERETAPIHCRVPDGRQRHAGGDSDGVQPENGQPHCFPVVVKS
jgi:hypothetical protein